jgi:hypothetical protein
MFVRLSFAYSTTQNVRRALLGTLFASTVALHGCVGLEVANAVVQTGNTAVSDLVSAQRMTVVSNELDSATPAIYKPYHYRAGQECMSSALVVPYERTWPEEIKQGEEEVRVLPPEPGKIAGYIAVVYKKACPGAGDQPILRAGRQNTITGAGTIFTRAFSADRTTYFMDAWDSALDSRDLVATSPGDQPKWWPQIVLRLIKLADSNPAVKTALAYDLDLFVQAAPTQASALWKAAR